MALLDVTPPRRRHGGRWRAAAAAGLLVLAGGPLRGIDPRLAITQLSHQVWLDELPQSTVLSLLQTRDGYLWVGTYEGVARFDGVRFTVFDRRSGALAGTTALHLAEDQRHRLWIGTNGGLTVMEGDAFHTYGLADGLPALMVRTVLPASDGTIWIGTDAGVAELRDGVVRPRAELGRDEVRALVEGADHAIWAATEHGLLRIAGATATRLGVAEGLPSASCRTLLAARDGVLWVGTDAGLARYSAGRMVAMAPEASTGDGYIRALAEDRDGNLWVGTEAAGLSRLHGGRWERYRAAQGLSNDFVRSLLEDREGNLWVGTNGGLNRLTAGKVTPWGVLEGLPQDFVRSVFADREGRLWVGTDGGGAAYRDGGGWHAITTRDGLSYDSVRAIAQTPDGAIWLGTRDGLDRWRDGHVEQMGRLLPNRLVRALYPDRTGALWVGAEGGGLVRLRGDEVTVLGTEQGLGASDVRAIAEDGDGRIWVGTYGGGLSRIVGSTVTTFRVSSGLPNDLVFAFHQSPEGLWVGTDSGLALLPASDLAAAPGKARFVRFATADGLYDDKVFRILEDAHGTLWMSSNRGIFNARRADLLAHAAGGLARVPSLGLTRADGMRATQCNGTSQPAGWRTADGHLWFPTVAGLVEVDPDHLRSNTLPPPVVIEQVRVDGAPRDLRSDPRLPADIERLEVDFTALSFMAPEKVRFRYRLVGSDRDWTEIAARRTAYYTHLPPGDYRFEVRAANNDGVWARRAVALPFSVATPLGRTWWAYALYVVLGAGVIGTVVQMRLRALAAANALLEARVAERTAALDEKVHQLEASEHKAHESEQRALEASRAKSVFLSNMSHELRTPLNSIIGFSQILEARLADELSEKHRRFLINILRSGEHLLQLINGLLDLSKIEAGRMELRAEAVDVGMALQEARELIRGFSAEKGIMVEVEPSPRLPTLTTDPAKLRQILLNLLSNAIKFSPPGSAVQLRARPVYAGDEPLLQDGVRIDVVDHGIGIAPEHQDLVFEEFRQVESDLARSSEGTGLGLALVKRLLELHGGLVQLESTLGKGSTFSIFLPRVAQPRRRGPAGAVVLVGAPAANVGGSDADAAASGL